MTVVEVTDATFPAVVLESELPVLVDYWAEWCSPCKQLAPIIDELADEFDGQIRFVRLDTGSNPLTPADHRVMGLPTLQIFHHGTLVSSFKGSKNKAVIIKALRAVL